MSKVLVIGDSMLDYYLYGNINRQSPEDKSVPVLDITKTEYRLGGCLNTAANIKSLNSQLQVNVCAPVSSFTYGLLREKGIEPPVLSFVQKDAYQPHPDELVKMRIIDEKTKKQIVRVDNKEKFPEKDYFVPYSFADYDAVVISDYCKGMVNDKVIDSLKKYKGPVFVDTKKSDLTIWKNIENCVVKINSKENQKASGHMSLKHLIVTEGASGCTLFSCIPPTRGQVAKSFMTEPVKNADTVGCGDVFLSGLVVEYLNSRDLDKAIMFANKVASESAKYFGTVEVKL